MRSLCCMWIGLVAMKVWIRPDFAVRIASPARRTSLSEARGGDSRLDHVHAELFQLARNAQLFFPGHSRAGALLAVAQGSVENNQFVCHFNWHFICHGKTP